jgi:hypothetical protein
MMSGMRAARAVEQIASRAMARTFSGLLTLLRVAAGFFLVMPMQIELMRSVPGAVATGSHHPTEVDMLATRPGRYSSWY